MSSKKGNAKAWRGRPVGRPPRHGSRALARLLQENRLDGRTKTARVLRAIATDLGEDCGGWGHCTNRERLLIERTAAAALILESIEGWIFRQQAPVGPTGELLNVLRRGYVSHLAQLTRCLAALGLRPDRAARAITLADYLEEHSTTPAHENTPTNANAHNGKENAHANATLTAPNATETAEETAGRAPGEGGTACTNRPQNDDKN